LSDPVGDKYLHSRLKMKPVRLKKEYPGLIQNFSCPTSKMISPSTM
jgi:hypothetical protein